MKYESNIKYCNYCKKDYKTMEVRSGDIVCCFCGTIIIKTEKKPDESS